jgi:hypothetical protein
LVAVVVLVGLAFVTAGLIGARSAMRGATSGWQRLRTEALYRHDGVGLADVSYGLAQARLRMSELQRSRPQGP